MAAIVWPCASIVKLQIAKKVGDVELLLCVLAAWPTFTSEDLHVSHHMYKQPPH